MKYSQNFVSECCFRGQKSTLRKPTGGIKGSTTSVCSINSYMPGILQTDVPLPSDLNLFQSPSTFQAAMQNSRWLHWVMLKKTIGGNCSNIFAKWSVTQCPMLLYCLILLLRPLKGSAGLIRWMGFDPGTAKSQPGQFIWVTSTLGRHGSHLSWKP